MSEDRPRIMPLDVVPVQAGGQQGFLLRDPRGLATRGLMVAADVVSLVSQFDGAHTVREAQLSYMRRFGTLLASDRIEGLLEQLDEPLFLGSARPPGTRSPRGPSGALRREASRPPTRSALAALAARD